MKKWLSIKTLFRSKLKTLVTFLLVAAVTFALFSQVAEYINTKIEFENNTDMYNGYGIVEASPVKYKRDEYPFYIEADPRVDCFPHEDYNNMRYGLITQEQVQEIASLPGVSSYNVRYMTGGICDSLIRGFDYYQTYDYTARLVIECTLEDISTESLPLYITDPLMKSLGLFTGAIYVSNVEILAGDADVENLVYEWAKYNINTLGITYSTYSVEKLRDYLNNPAPMGGANESDANEYNDNHWGGVANDVEITSVASNTYIYDYDYLSSTMEPGRRYVLILRFTRAETEQDHRLQFLYCSLYDFLTEPWCKAVWDVTDAPENYLELEEYAPLKECIEITQQDLHTFDVVYTDDMSVIKQVHDGNMNISQGRWLSPEDTETNTPVCVISSKLASVKGLELGDTLSLKLGDETFEQFYGLGAVAVTPERFSDNWTEPIDFEIVGIYDDQDEFDLSREPNWTYSSNTIFVPMSFLPLTDEQLQDHEFSPAEFSFTVDNAWNIEKFVNEGIPQIEAMGLTVTFDDGGWLEVVQSYESAQRLAVIRIVLLVLVTVIATVFIVYLYITRRRKDYAIMRALGTGRGKSSSALLLPLMVLGVTGIIIGTLLGVLYTAITGGTVFFWVVCICLLSETALTLISALFMLRKLGRLSPLALLQDTSKNKKKRTAVQKSDTAETNDLSLDGVLSGVPHTETGIKDFRGPDGSNGDIWDASIRAIPAADSTAPPIAPPGELMPKRSHRLVRFVTGYVLRHARRQAVKSLLAVLLAVLMVGAVTQFAKMKDTYSDLRRDTVVTARFNASLPLFQLRSLEGGGFAANSYYEYTREYDINHNDRGDNFNRAYITITNDIPRYTNEECTIEYAPGYDETVMDKLSDAIIMSSALMETMGYELGDTVRITPGGYTDEFINKLRINFKDEHPELQTVPDALYTTYGEYIESAIDEMADVFTIVGVVTTPSGAYDSFAFSPGQVDSLSNMGSAVTLDIAEFRLADNELADKMTEKGKELTRGQTGAFVMDTSKLDSVIRTSEILNSLYPAAVAAALVIGAFLCALIIFQTSTEAAIMRVLGTTKKKTAAILTAEQCILALLGIILGILITAVINGGVSAQSLIFSGAYFAVILLGSAISSVLVTRRNILDLLQTKE